MSQTHKTDDYNLMQPSQSGRAGFESFKGQDGRFYFHFNAADGSALLFSQAYRREIDRDKGIQSVIKNAANENHFSQVGTEGLFYFTLRASNGQEIARSRYYANAKDVKSQRTFFIENLSLSTFSATGTPEKISLPTPETAEYIEYNDSDCEDTTLKNTMASVKTQLKNQTKVDFEAIDNSTDVEPLRQVFRIEIYKGEQPEKFNGKITHPFSNESQTFVGFDNQVVMGFIADKIQVEMPQKEVASVAPVAMVALQPNVAPPQYEAQKTANQVVREAIPNASTAELSQLVLTNLSNAKNAPQSNTPFEVSLRPHIRERGNAVAAMACRAEVNVFALDTRQKYKLLDKRLFITVPEDDNNGLAVNIQPLVLDAGSYRLTVKVSVLSSSDLNSLVVSYWQGSTILSLY